MNNDSSHKKLSDDSVVRGHETSDASVKHVAIAGVGLSMGLVLGGLIVAALAYFVFKSHSPSPGAPAETLVVPDSARLAPLPRIQADPHVVLVPYVKMQDSILSSYGWVNKDSNIARIPVERAMEVIVKRGLPVHGKQ